MTPAPLSKVIKVVATAMQYDPVRNRTQVVETINGVIAMLYRNDAFRKNHCRVEDCVLTQNFIEHCNGCSPRSFTGVVIPSGIRNITELRVNDTMLDLSTSRVPGGCSGRRNCPPKAERLMPRLLEADIPSCGDSRFVTFRSSEPQADCGKSVGVRYVDMNNNEVREDVVLDLSPMATSTSVLAFLEISLPERSGFMHIETANGAFLGKYHPSIYKPQHEWFRLESTLCSVRVGYRGTREPIPAVFDTDIVLFSDLPQWRVALKAYAHLDSMELESNQLRAIERMYASLAGISNEDLEANNKNFTATLLPETARTMLSTGRAMSR